MAVAKTERTVDKDLAEDFDEYINIILKECPVARVSSESPGFWPPEIQRLSFRKSQLVSGHIKLLQNHLKYYPKDMCAGTSGTSSIHPADASQLKQVVLNLLFNALDATQEGDRLSCARFQRTPRVGLAVEDNGCGIPSEILQAFRTFFTTKPAARASVSDCRVL
jgi:signal transduction histidine kinase